MSADNQYAADGLPITYVPNPYAADGAPVNNQWKNPAHVATTGNITLSGLQTVDGVSLMEGFRVLVKDQALPQENGLWIASATDWLRAPDMYLWEQFVAAVVAIEEGTANGGTIWHSQAPITGTVGVTPNYWVTSSGGSIPPLSDLLDVYIPTPVNGQHLSYNGSVWIAANPASALHNDLGGLQGGGSNAFYHLTQEDYSQLPVTSALAQSAYSLAQIGTNTGSAAYSLATSAYSLATSWTGTVVQQSLTGNRTYYVSTTGSNSNDGLSVGTAFLTVQKAIDVVTSLLIPPGIQVTIKLSNGTYTGANVLRCLVGGGSVVIRGDTTTPSNVVISTDEAINWNADSLNTSAHCFEATSATNWTLSGLKLQSTVYGHLISAAASSYIKFDNINFGVASGGFSHIYATTSSYVLATSNYTISGAAFHHVNVENSATVIVGGRTITFATNPTNFSGNFAEAFGASIAYLNSMVFTNFAYATGAKYLAYGNGVIYTNGASTSYLPGNSAGSTSSGGQYI